MYFLRIHDNCAVKKKMVYAGSKVEVESKLLGLSVKVHATDLGECERSVIEDSCRKFS